MTLVLTLIDAFLAIGILVVFGATIELHRQVLQLRQHAGLVARSRVLQFNETVLRSSLPGYEALSSNMERSAIVLLSDGCSTCLDIARALPRKLSPRLHIVLTARSVEVGHEWLSQFGIDPSSSVTIDDGTIMDVLGLNLSPALVTFDGEFARSAVSLPSAEQLAKALEWLRPRESNGNIVGEPSREMLKDA